MKKEIIINYSYVKKEYLIRLFEKGELSNWVVVKTNKELSDIIRNFYN